MDSDRVVHFAGLSSCHLFPQLLVVALSSSSFCEWEAVLISLAKGLRLPLLGPFTPSKESERQWFHPHLTCWCACRQDIAKWKASKTTEPRLVQGRRGRGHIQISFSSRPATSMYMNMSPLKRCKCECECVGVYMSVRAQRTDRGAGQIPGNCLPVF